MTVGIVHLLEVVNIQHRQHCLLIGTIADFELGFHHVKKPGAVTQTRQRIGIRQVTQFFIGSFKHLGMTAKSLRLNAQ